VHTNRAAAKLGEWARDTDVEMMLVPVLRTSGGEPALLLKRTN
jgi:hypothetical protein